MAKIRIIASENEILNAENLYDCILVKSYDKYKKLGGERNEFDTYAHFKSKAKKYERLYIQYMNMSLSDIDVPEESIALCYNLAQIFWGLLHLWFNVPLRKVSFTNFDLREFYNL